MVSAIHELAIELQTAAWPIAMLVESGVSRSVGVPTEQELRRNVARRLGENPGEDPVDWYRWSGIP